MEGEAESFKQQKIISQVKLPRETLSFNHYSLKVFLSQTLSNDGMVVRVPAVIELTLGEMTSTEKTPVKLELRKV